MAFVSVTQDVREEAENILVQDFPDADIVKEQQAAYGFLKGRIGAYDGTHPNIDAVRKLEQMLAAVFIMSYFSQKKDAAESKYTRFKELLVEFEGTLTDVLVDAEHIMTSSDYVTPAAARLEDPMSEVTSYKSTRTFAMSGILPREIETPSNPLLPSNNPAYIITGQRQYI